MGLFSTVLSSKRNRATRHCAWIWTWRPKAYLSVQQAKEALLEAFALYLETALENNLPCLRPVPPSEDPRFVDAEHVVDEFPLNVSVTIRAYA